MKTKLLISFAILLVFLAGCAQERQFVCSDGSVVDDLSKCPTTEKPEEPIEIPCNNDGKCDAEEDCSCNDCTGLLKCKELSEDEYLLMEDDIKKIDGKSITLVTLESNGKSTVTVDGVTKEIPGTNEMEIVNGLEITINEVSYDPAKEETGAIFEMKKYEPGLEGYLFETTGAEKIVESVRIRLNKVEQSTPQNFVRLTVGVVQNEKLKEGETREIEGLSITLVKSWPKGTPAESYALLKVKKA